MSIRYLDLSGAVNFWTNIKNFILSKIPTKTSELTNDSGYITNTNTCLHKSGGETFTGYKTVENINSGLIFKSTDYQAEIRLSGNEPYDVSIVSHKLSNDTYSYYTLMDRCGNVFPGIYRPRASNLTVYVSNTVSSNSGNDGLSASTPFSLTEFRNFLNAIRMQSGSSLGGTYSLTVNLIPTGTSYGTCRFDSTKMPYVKNLVIQTSTGIEGTPENYTTNCPDLLQLYISGNMDVTVRNIKCGEIAVYQGAKVTLTNFNAVGQVRADNNGYVIVGGYLYVFYYPLSTSPRVSLFDASLDGHIRIESANTTINFSEQVYYTAGVLRTISHGYMYANISRWKLLGIKPCVIAGSSTTILTTCSTPGNVSAKTVETGTTIGTSTVIGVTFSETNTANNPTLNVNGLGDWQIVADTNAVDIKHYLPFGVKIIFKRFGNTWKITNTKDILQYIAGDCSMSVSGNLGTTYNNGEFNFGDYIVSQSTSSTNTGIYNAVQYNINGTNIFDGIRTITQPWVYTATQSIKLTTTLGGTVYQDKGIKFTDNNSASIGYLYGCTFNNGGSGVGISASNVIDNATVSKGIRVVLTNDGKSYLYPGNPNDTSLGSEYFTWKGVYATNYYYGANNVEFSTKFVTTDTEQIITGTKTFNSVRGIDLSEKTIDLNDCYSSIAGGVIRYYCNTNSGTNNISNIPTNSSFSMISETYRYLSASDYLVKQTIISNSKTRRRFCSNGTWTDWKEIVDTDVNVTNTLATTTKAYLTGTTSSSTNTGTQIFDTGVYLSTTAGELVATKFTGALNGTADKATKDGNGNVISSTYATVSDMTEMTAEEVIAIANQILV